MRHGAQNCRSWLGCRASKETSHPEGILVDGTEMCKLGKPKGNGYLFEDLQNNFENWD